MKETRAPAHDHRVSPAVFLSCLFLCAGLASSAEATNVLRGVEMYTNRARLSLDGPPHYTVSLLENPDRLVMDLHGTRHAAPQSDWSGSGAPLRGVRSLQRGTPAKPATRLVFDLAGPVRYWAAWNGVQLLVRLESEDGVKSSPAPGAPTRRFDGRLMDPLGVPMDGTFLLDFSCAGRGGARVPVPDQQVGAQSHQLPE